MQFLKCKGCYLNEAMATNSHLNMPLVDILLETSEIKSAIDMGDGFSLIFVTNSENYFAIKLTVNDLADKLFLHSDKIIIK